MFYTHLELIVYWYGSETLLIQEVTPLALKSKPFLTGIPVLSYLLKNTQNKAMVFLKDLQAIPVPLEFKAITGIQHMVQHSQWGVCQKCLGKAWILALVKPVFACCPHHVLFISLLFFLNDTFCSDLFYWKAKWQRKREMKKKRERERRRQKERASLVRSADGCNDQCWARMKPQTWKPIWISHVGGIGPSTWAILLHCSPR